MCNRGVFFDHGEPPECSEHMYYSFRGTGQPAARPPQEEKEIHVMASSKGYFDEVAGQWDEMRQSFFSDAVREKALSVADVEPGKRAADIGAGTGFIAEALTRKGFSVVAVDQSEEMLGEMQRRFVESDPIDYRVGEAECLPISDDSVDYAFANMYLHHVKDPPAAIEEMARILRAGGTLVITDLDEHDFEFLKVEQHDQWMGFKREDIRRWFRKAGLGEVVVDCAGEECCTESTSGDRAAVSLFVASGKR